MMRCPVSRFAGRHGSRSRIPVPACETVDLQHTQYSMTCKVDFTTRYIYNGLFEGDLMVKNGTNVHIMLARITAHVNGGREMAAIHSCLGCLMFCA